MYTAFLWLGVLGIWLQTGFCAIEEEHLRDPYDTFAQIQRDWETMLGVSSNLRESLLAESEPEEQGPPLER